MECKMDTGLLQGYLDGTLNTLEKIIVEEHLKGCEACQKEVTEMNLLLFELVGMMESELDIPIEVSHVRERILNDYISLKSTEKFGIKQFIDTQQQVLKNAGIFLEFVPGTSYIEKGIKKAPSLLYKAVKNSFSSGMRLMAARARA